MNKTNKFLCRNGTDRLLHTSFVMQSGGWVAHKFTPTELSHCTIPRRLVWSELLEKSTSKCAGDFKRWVRVSVWVWVCVWSRSSVMFSLLLSFRLLYCAELSQYLKRFPAQLWQPSHRLPSSRRKHSRRTSTLPDARTLPVFAISIPGTPCTGNRTWLWDLLPQSSFPRFTRGTLSWERHSQQETS